MCSNIFPFLSNKQETKNILKLTAFHLVDLLAQLSSVQFINFFLHYQILTKSKRSPVELIIGKNWWNQDK